MGYQHAIVGYCSHMLGGAAPEEVEEVAQEVFLAAYRALPRFQQQASVRTWLFTIAHNRCVTHRTRTTRHRHVAADHRRAVVAAVHPTPPVPPGPGAAGSSTGDETRAPVRAGDSKPAAAQQTDREPPHAVLLRRALHRGYCKEALGVGDHHPPAAPCGGATAQTYDGHTRPGMYRS